MRSTATIGAIVIGCLITSVGCAPSNGSYVNLHIRDVATHTPLSSGRIHYEYKEGAPFGVDTAMGGQPVHQGVAEFFIKPGRAVTIKVLDTPEYLPIIVKLEAPDDLKHFTPTPWKKGEYKDSNDLQQLSQMLEFRLAPLE